jgi:hypothetical protein
VKIRPGRRKRPPLGVIPLGHWLKLTENMPPAERDCRRSRQLIDGSIRYRAAGMEPDPAWHAEWAALLARRVRATEG